MSIRKRLASLVLALAIGAAVYGPAPGMAEDQVKIEIVKKGEGTKAARYAKVSVHYTGWLEDGTKFDSSRDRGKPLEFFLGTGQVIKGWDIGVLGMRIGGKRILVIPPHLGYGKRGAGTAVPPDATLKFEVELLGVELRKFTGVDSLELKALLDRGVKIIDVRRTDEWDQGRVEGSQLLTAFNTSGQFNRYFVDKFKKLVQPDEEVILICQHGNRTAALADMLSEKQGYSKIYNVTEGIKQWIDDGFPVVK